MSLDLGLGVRAGVFNSTLGPARQVLGAASHAYVAVDWNPDHVHQAHDAGVRAVLGNMTQFQVLEELGYSLSPTGGHQFPRTKRGRSPSACDTGGGPRCFNDRTCAVRIEQGSTAVRRSFHGRHGRRPSNGRLHGFLSCHPGAEHRSSDVAGVSGWPLPATKFSS